MESEDIIKYMNDNYLDYQMISLLLFYDEEFFFMPVNNPSIYKENDSISLIGGDGYNMLGSGYQTPGMTDVLSSAPGGMRFFNHPEHIRAFVMRYKDGKYVVYNYSRSNTSIKYLRETAFSSFLFIFDINDIESLNASITKAEINRERYLKYRYYSPDTDRQVTDADLLMDEVLEKSLDYHSINYQDFYTEIKNRLREVDSCITEGLYVTCDSILELTTDESKKVVSIYCTQNYTPISNIKTSLVRPCTVISETDKISDLLYLIAAKIDANIFYIATGYAYESGLEMIEPVMELVKNHDNANIEMIIGALQHYKDNSKSKELNYKTAKKINQLKEYQRLSILMTRRDCFYHGKFYYISNGNVSYIICGSSNVTQSAYEKNNELDLLFRFDENSDRYLEEKFLERYNSLKNQCEILNNLNLDCFDKNYCIDESGKSKTDNIYRQLSNDEEKQRFDFIKSLKPDDIYDFPFAKRVEFSSFKNYSVFIFEKISIAIIEGFSYGDACYILEATELEDIKKIIAMKSKNEVKRDERFIASINHDEQYCFKFNQVLNNR